MRDRRCYDPIFVTLISTYTSTLFKFLCYKTPISNFVHTASTFLE